MIIRSKLLSILPERVVAAGRFIVRRPDAADRPFRWFQHALRDYRPPNRFGFRVDAPDDSMEAIVSRLADYYHRQVSDAERRGMGTHADMWERISLGYQEFRTALEARDSVQLSHQLLNVGTGPLVAGFGNIAPFNRLRKDARERTREAKHFVDKLLSLSEALGCSTVQCPEQGDWGYEVVDFERLLDAVEKRVGFSIAPPLAGGGLFGLQVDERVLCLKDLTAIYTAARAKDLLERASDTTVAEIGGGLGTLAYYLAKAGCQRVSVFDLPVVSILQGYCLMRSLGPNNVWLYGEPPSGAVVRLFPHWALAKEPDKSISLCVNQDSLPEIETGAAQNYVRLIRAKCHSYFLSINQEARAPNAGGTVQSVVHELIEQHTGFERLSRFPHWMRPGYVEELYRIQ